MHNSFYRPIHHNHLIINQKTILFYVPFIFMPIKDNKITIDTDIYFTITKSGDNYTIKSASGYFIGQTSNANGLKSNVSKTMYLKPNSPKSKKPFLSANAVSATGKFCPAIRHTAITSSLPQSAKNPACGRCRMYADSAAGSKIPKAAAPGPR